MNRERERERESETERQRDRQTDTERQIETETDRQRGRQAGKRTDRESPWHQKLTNKVINTRPENTITKTYQTQETPG